MKNILLSVITFLLFYTHSDAAPLSGRVTGISNEPLAFANVYLKGTSRGTTTNIDGYYKLEVPDGMHEVVFRFLGYKMKVVNVNVTGSPLSLDVTLEEENYTLGQVTINAEAEDPAYAIIRKAIEKRKFYLNQVNEFSCDVYIKGLQKITKYPEKFLGVDVNLGQFVDSTTGIIYLSESVSQYNFKKPDNIREVMISSRVSGSNRAFSFNQASDMDFNFYENIMEVGGLSQRGCISPIASNALFYYRYKLEGSFFENGHWVNKIQVIPRRKNDPVFSGYIYIQDGLWRIHSTDLYLTRESQIEFVDTLRVNQVFIPATANDEVWMQGSVTFKFYFSAFGFEGNGNYAAVYSNYVIDPGFEKGFFSGMIMKVNEDANKKDSSYWETLRPVPLTSEESRDYVKRDSMRVIKESKPYLDSLDRESNKFSGSDLLSGYTYSNRYTKTGYHFSSLLDNIQFNTVEGLTVGLGVGFTKRYEDRRSFTADVNGRYGFSNEKFNPVAAIRYTYNPRKFAYIAAEGGSNHVQFNESEPISPIINTSYTLFAEKNYMKLFRKQYGRIESGREITNGVRLNAFFEYASREAVTNTTDYTFSDRKNRNYTSNNPLNPLSDVPSFEKNYAFKMHLGTRIRFRQKYIDRPDMNYIIGSKYPELLLNYTRGFADINYDRIEAGVEDRIRLGMLGSFSYYGVYGKFLSAKKLYFMDLAHFNGNQTFLSGFEPRRFDLLEYYKYSTADEYIQVFTEHDFGGFILNKIPLLRKLKLTEIAGFRYLHVPHLDDHYEFSIGLQKLDFLRAEFVMSPQNGKLKTGFLFGAKGIIK